MRNNADRFPRPWEGRRPDKSVSQKRAASPGTGLFWGFGGFAPNKRIEQLRPRRDAQFCRMGPILHRLPVSPAPVFPRPPFLTPNGRFRHIPHQNHLFPARNTPTTPDTIPLAGPSDNLDRKQSPEWYDWNILSARANRLLPLVYLHQEGPHQFLHPRPANTLAANQNRAQHSTFS